MKIKLVRNYSTYTVGHVVDCENETAERLIRDGIAVREPGQVETASIEPEVERADARPRRGRKPNAIPQPDQTDGPGD